MFGSSRHLSLNWAPEVPAAPTELQDLSLQPNEEISVVRGELGTTEVCFKRNVYKTRETLCSLVHSRLTGCQKTKVASAAFQL